jgi:adenylate cyclase
MIALVDRALVLNPSFARGHYIGAILRMFAGQPDLAIEDAEVSLRLSPRGRFGVVFVLIGGAHLFAHRFDQAVPKLILAIQEDATNPMPYRFLAACYAHMGRLDEARDVLCRLRTITAAVVPDAGFLRKPEDRELLLSGLRLAAGEAT